MFLRLHIRSCHNIDFRSLRHLLNRDNEIDAISLKNRGTTKTLSEISSSISLELPSVICEVGLYTFEI